MQEVEDADAGKGFGDNVGEGGAGGGGSEGGQAEEGVVELGQSVDGDEEVGGC